LIKDGRQCLPTVANFRNQSNQSGMLISKKQKVINLLNRVSAGLLGCNFQFVVKSDQAHNNGRLYIQCEYFSPCTHTGEKMLWKGRKWYLSEGMTDDEVIKTAYCAFEAAVKHEIMEGFKVDGTILFNPHVNFEELLKVSHLEVTREEVKNA
jgi:hypothetical protein